MTKERIDLGIMRPSGASGTLARAARALGQPTPDHQPLLDHAPEMPAKFWGTVAFNYQGGRLVNVQVTESIKPE